MIKLVNNEQLIIALYVQPGARVSQLVGEHGGRLKLKISAPPVEGKANAAVIEYFVKLFNLPRKAVTIIAGEHSRQKQVQIFGDSASLYQQLQQLLQGSKDD